MKRAALLHCADMSVARYKVYKQRGQLPFKTEDGRLNNANLDHAWRLRLMLDLLGDEGNSGDDLGGLAASFAGKAVSHSLVQFPRHPLNQIEPYDWWCGVLVLEDEDADGETMRSSEWFAGDLLNLQPWIEDKSQRLLGEGLARPVRLFFANATRAAEFVRDRAHDLGVPETDDFSSVALNGGD